MPATPTAIDLLLEARWIVPVNPAGVVLENHAVAVNNGRIVAVLQQHLARQNYVPRETKRLPHHILIPGLVNLHTHAAMSLLRGIADDQPLMTWLQEHIWPIEAKHVSPHFVFDGTRLACAEMLRSGITCFADMYFFPKAVAEAALACGMRASIGLIAIDFPTAYASDADDYLAKGLAVRDALNDEDLLSFCLAPHAPYTACDQTLTKVVTLAEQCDLPIHAHLHETRQEIADSLKQYGARPIERLRQLNALGPNLLAAHGVHLTPGEIELLAEHGCTIAHCPTSNLKLASGIAPLAELVGRGVSVGLGTDGSASNNRLDIFGEMRLAALLAKGSSGDASVVSAQQALNMATLGGARALGLENDIGSLEAGKWADMCAIDINDDQLSPCYDLISHLVYCAGREYVSDVWVAGKPRFTNGHLPGITEIELKNLAALWQNQIRPHNV